jgi:hypothetical protein
LRCRNSILIDMKLTSYLSASSICIDSHEEKILQAVDQEMVYGVEENFVRYLQLDFRKTSRRCVARPAFVIEIRLSRMKNICIYV